VNVGKCVPIQEPLEFMGPLSEDDLRSLAKKWGGRFAVRRLAGTENLVLADGAICKCRRGDYLMKIPYEGDKDRWYWRGVTAERFQKEYKVEP